MASTIDQRLDEARRELVRLSPEEAREAQARGAVLVDLRPESYRTAEGAIPGALVVERNVLEWRFDPTCEARLDVASPDLHVVLLCNDGYASSLAAVALHTVGVPRATDLVGGYRAWRAAGLPTTSGQESPEA